MKIVLGISGSIAAYRSPDVVKRLTALGHNVRCVVTDGGREFVSTKALETFSGYPVLSPNMFGDEHFATDHISAARWADIFIIYGATANLIGRVANGLADDFLTLQLIAFAGPVIVAPAMNPSMWSHAAVAHNVATLVKRGYHIVQPIEGVVACGESGIGHVASDDDIIARLNRVATTPPCPGLVGKKVLISAGPMRTALDPVRYIQNRSSGKMGLALASACAKAGAASVEILLGHVASDMRTAFAPFPVRPYVEPSDYDAALAEMFPRCDVFFSAAAVLDFEAVAQQKKIDRAALASAGKLETTIRPVPDMVAKYAARKAPHQKIIAFAAETGSPDEIVARATTKMQTKNVDAIIANPVEDGLGPDADTNRIWIIRPGQQPHQLGPAPKSELGHSIVAFLFGACENIPSA